jgi:hypothetical protein
MRNVVLAALQVALWLSAAGSLANLTVGEIGRQNAEQSDHLMDRLGADNGKAREDRYMRNLARHLNPVGQTPIVFVASVGFLAVIEMLRRNAAVEAAVPVPAGAVVQSPRPNPKAKGLVVNERDGV